MVSIAPFNRSGLAVLSDLRTPEWGELFAILEKAQSSFLAHESEFRSPEYKWPRDPLHNWSRCWEYPYVYHHIRRWKAGLPNGRAPHVVDIGSGVTFFPFAVAQMGCNVSCCDIDLVCEKDMLRAACAVPHSPGRVGFRLVEGTYLPFEDEEVDAAYCISVIEHLSDFDTFLKEVRRILKPGGLFVVTFDLDLRGDHEIGPLKYRRLKDTIKELFSTREHEMTIHPVDLLTSCNSSYPIPAQSFHLAVEGQILTRKI